MERRVRHRGETRRRREPREGHTRVVNDLTGSKDVDSTETIQRQSCKAESKKSRGRKKANNERPRQRQQAESIERVKSAYR
jgi:hypothetical protein